MFQSRIHPVSDFHTLNYLGYLGDYEVFQSRIHPVSDFHWVNAPEADAEGKLFQSRIHPVSDFHGGAGGDASDVTINVSIPYSSGL